MQSITRFIYLCVITMFAFPITVSGETAKSCNGNSKCGYWGKSSVFISYNNASTNSDLEAALELNVGFNGNPNFHQFIMDTGSCGIVASPDIFQPAPGAINLGPGETHYTDGTFERELTGDFWTATQQIYNANGKLLATSSVPVLLVTQEVDNGQIKVPSGVAVFGIGFGREGSDQPPKTPAYNAFLNLNSIFKKGKLRSLPRDWVNGYVVYPNGVALGLTAKNTNRAGFIKLTQWDQYSTSDLPEWMPMTVGLCVNGVCAEGTSVMDTGIKNSIINPPAGATLGTLINCPNTQQAQCVPNGNVIDIYYPTLNHPIAFYTITTGQSGNPMQPDSVAVQSRPTVYWNTSRHLLGGMNYVYDNTHGYAGFIWNHQTNHKFGYVVPNGEQRFGCCK